jgi:uncharacterized membrane protein
MRYIDIDRLIGIARECGIRLRLERRVGNFVPAGVPIIRASKLERMSEDVEIRLLVALDIGPTSEQSSCLSRILRRRLLSLFVEFHDAAS